MKKIAFLIISALIVLATIGVGTWAYFSDTQSSTANVFTAGTLDLGVANSAGTQTGDTTATFNATTLKPGDTVTGDLHMYNAGSIDAQTLKVTFNYDATNMTSGRPSTITGSPWSLSTDKFDDMITATTATYDGASVAAIAGKTLTQLKAAGAIVLPKSASSYALPSHTDLPLHIVFTFSTTATNGCQGNSLSVTLTVNAYQQAGA